MEHTKRTRIVKQILASLSKCFFAMRIAFIFKFYSKFLQRQSYVFSLWDGGRLTTLQLAVGSDRQGQGRDRIEA